MKCKNPFFHCSLALLTFAAVLLAAPAKVQSQNMPSQNMPSQDPGKDQGRDRDNDQNSILRGQLASFDNYLDGHPEVAQDLRKDPSLIDNQEYLEKHPALRDYLQQHPEVREEVKQNPNAFMHREERYDRREDARNGDRDVTRTELANMDRFMDSHPEIAEQLRRDPSLVDNKTFVANHPALQQFLADHPGVREEYKENPNGFMHQEERYDRREDRDRDVTRGELANMDRFMDGHPEIAEQLRKDPSLVNNKTFVANHPALQQFLAEHPGVREEYKENPNAFMHQEERFDRREDGGMRRDRDVTGGELASFNEFLGSHDKIADELSKNPSLAKNQEYLENHPQLQDYLKTHPGVHEELSENPEGFLKSAQQYNPRATTTPKMAGESKPK